MNCRIPHRTCLLLTVVAPLLAGTGAQAQNPHAGTWETSELTIRELAAGCRYVEAVTATFDLAAGINNAVAGRFTRQFLRQSWDSNPGCAMPGVDTYPYCTLRQDSWLVQGEPQGRDTQRLKGVYAGCSTDCKEPWSPPASFETELVRRPGGMSTGLLTGIVGATMFRDSFRSQLDSANASEAFIKLVEPLLEGKCDEFLLRSVDADYRQRWPRDVTCAYSTALSQLVPTVILHRKTDAYAPTLAWVEGVHGPLLLTEGDVLVRRFLVVYTDGGGMFLRGALRRQGDGSWKVLDILR